MFIIFYNLLEVLLMKFTNTANTIIPPTNLMDITPINVMTTTTATTLTTTPMIELPITNTNTITEVTNDDLTVTITTTPPTKITIPTSVINKPLASTNPTKKPTKDIACGTIKKPIKETACETIDKAIANGIAKANESNTINKTNNNNTQRKQPYRRNKRKTFKNQTTFRPIKKPKTEEHDCKLVMVLRNQYEQREKNKYKGSLKNDSDYDYKTDDDKHDDSDYEYNTDDDKQNDHGKQSTKKRKQNDHGKQSTKKRKKHNHNNRNHSNSNNNNNNSTTNEEYQTNVKNKLENDICARIFDILKYHGEMTPWQISAMLGYSRTSTTFQQPFKKMIDGKYFKTRSDGRDGRTMYYSLNDKAFLHPTNREPTTIIPKNILDTAMVEGTNKRKIRRVKNEIHRSKNTSCKCGILCTQNLEEN
jgi:hypothetical protein